MSSRELRALTRDVDGQQLVRTTRTRSGRTMSSEEDEGVADLQALGRSGEGACRESGVVRTRASCSETK